MRTSARPRTHSSCTLVASEAACRTSGRGPTWQRDISWRTSGRGEGRSDRTRAKGWNRRFSHCRLLGWNREMAPKLLWWILCTSKVSNRLIWSFQIRKHFHAGFRVEDSNSSVYKWQTWDLSNMRGCTIVMSISNKKNLFWKEWAHDQWCKWQGQNQPKSWMHTRPSKFYSNTHTPSEHLLCNWSRTLDDSSRHWCTLAILKVHNLLLHNCFQSFIKYQNIPLP